MRLSGRTCQAKAFARWSETSARLWKGRQQNVRKLIRRAAKLADDFAKWRAKQGTMQCDDCKFDPATRPDLAGIKPRSCLDVHHKNPLAEGKRLTTRADLALLCPTCHRIKHLRLRQSGG